MIVERWYAVYVKSRNEKKVNARFEEANIESFLPILKTLRQWKDRKKLVEVPLFNSYVFVRVKPIQFTAVRQIDGVVNFVRLDSKPASIPDNQIESLKLLLGSSEQFEVSHDLIEVGEPVEVVKGTLTGFKGILVSYKGKKRAMLRIEAINQILMVDINPAFLLRVNSN
jgi:transcriptional antiterminator RfaH